MAFKDISINDVRGDKINEKAFETAAQPTKQAQPAGKKMYRSRSGEYNAQFGKVYIRLQDDGRKMLSIITKLHNEEDRYRGTAFTRASYQLVTKADGSPDAPFKIFQQILGVLNAPSTVKPEQVVEALEGEWVRVWGKEFFQVKVEDLINPEDRARCTAGGYKTSRVYIQDDKQDAEALSFLKKGYESQFHVMRVSAIPAAPGEPNGSDIPF